jgi:ankyrin repeat protein
MKIRFGIVMCAICMHLAVFQQAIAQQSQPPIIALINQYSDIQLTADLSRTNPSSPRVSAVDYGQLVNEVQALIAQGADVNTQDMAGRTALMQAVFSPSDALVEVLLNKGANPNLADFGGNTALIFASHQARLAVVDRLLAKGANPNARSTGEQSISVLDSFIVNPERDLAREGQVACIEALVKGGALINATISEQGTTPLMMAAARSNTALVKRMLSLGANVHAKDRFGITALFQASLSGHTENIQSLVDAGANSNDTLSGPMAGYTPLLAAIVSKHDGAANVLLKHSSKVTVNSRSATFPGHQSGSYTALVAAVEKGMDKLVPALLAKGANINANGNDQGSTAIMVAGQQNKMDLFAILLQNKPNLEVKNATGETALISIATFNTNAQALQMLLKAGAKTNAKNSMGQGIAELIKEGRIGKENAQVLRGYL